MRNQDHELCADEGTRHRELTSPTTRIRFSLFRDADLFEFDHDSRRLFGVSARADTKVNVRTRNFQIAQQHIRHARVIVLAGVDEERLDVRRRLHLLERSARIFMKFGHTPTTLIDFHVVAARGSEESGGAQFFQPGKISRNDKR